MIFTSKGQQTKALLMSGRGVLTIAPRESRPNCPFCRNRVMSGAKAYRFAHIVGKTGEYHECYVHPTCYGEQPQGADSELTDEQILYIWDRLKARMRQGIDSLGGRGE